MPFGGTRWLTRLSVVVALTSLVVLTSPIDASATVAPRLSVSPDSGPVGSVVTVRFSAPSNDGCGAVLFQSSATALGGSFVPSVAVPSATGSASGARFVVPSSLGAPPQTHYVPVTTGRHLFSLTCDTTDKPAEAVTVTVPFTVTSSAISPSRFVAMAATPDGGGYWLAQSGGGVFSYGNAGFFDSLPGLGVVPAAPIVGIAATPDGKGYWLAGADGGVFSFGNARFYGSLPGLGITPNGPIVGIAATPDGKGYWLVGSDGGVFAFGDAPYKGSAAYPNPASSLAPVVGLSATGNGQGYYEAGQEGGGWGFGTLTNTDNGALGFTNAPLVAPVTGIMTTPDGGGAWYVAADGGVFADGAAGGAAPEFFGSLPGLGVVPNAPIVGMAATPDDEGYWLVGADGGVFAFGKAGFYGSAGASGLPWES